MPVIVPNGLPAIKMLANENITVLSKSQVKKQDIRPLQIIILNLMPTKIATENQLIRVLSNTSLQVEITFLKTETHDSKNITPEHLESFYKVFSEIKYNYFDGLIITGAPVETLAFEEVDYWDELCEILNWSKTHVCSSIHICWGAQAGLYFHHGIEKWMIGKKLSGVYTHEIENQVHPLMRGFDKEFLAPHSRYTEVRIEDIRRNKALEILSLSAEAGVYMVATKDLRQVYITGHPEYDAHTLGLEYERDIVKGVNPNVPVNYFPDNNPQLLARNRWCVHSYKLFSNWLNHVDQKVPDQVQKIKELRS